MELSQAQKDFIVNLWVAANEICPQYNIKAIDGSTGLFGEWLWF